MYKCGLGCEQGAQNNGPFFSAPWCECTSVDYGRGEGECTGTHKIPTPLPNSGPRYLHLHFEPMPSTQVQFKFSALGYNENQLHMVFILKV